MIGGPGAGRDRASALPAPAAVAAGEGGAAAVAETAQIRRFEALENRVQATRTAFADYTAAQRTAGETMRQSLLMPTEIYNQRLERARELFDTGAISQQTFNRELVAAGDAWAAAGQQIETVGAQGDRVATILEAEFSSSFSSIESAISRMVEGGATALESLEGLGRAVAADLLKTFTKLAAINPIKNALFGSALPSLGSLFGGFGGGGAGALTTQGAATLSAKFGGLAMGGSFMVGGRGGTDSQLVSFAATPGERVDVSTPAQQRHAGGGGSGGDRYFIDARGADAGGLARLERTIRALDGSIEPRAIVAVTEARARAGFVEAG